MPHSSMLYSYVLSGFQVKMMLSQLYRLSIVLSFQYSAYRMVEELTPLLYSPTGLDFKVDG